MPPSALDRVSIAQSAIKSNSVSYPSRVNPSFHFLVDRKAADDLLKKHENLCRRRRASDEVDEGTAAKDYDHESSIDIETTDSSSCLIKPANRNPLLANALTNSNGSTWRRQRQLIQKAFANRQARKVAKEVALETALGLILAEANGPSRQKKEVVLDARKICLEVAVQAMSAAVFGKENGAELIGPVLHQVYDPSLVVRVRDAEALESLGMCVTSLVSRVAEHGVDGKETKGDSCLLHSLLRLEASPSECSIPTLCDETDSPPSAKPYLTRQEVVSNCHSALFAGTQSIATTLTASLLYCAERPPKGGETPPSVPQTVNGRAICHETLRILPPVATLPRCPKKDHHVTFGHSETKKTSSKTQESKLINAEDLILIDVLGMAHVVDQPNDTDDTLSTWKFCPATRGERKNTSSAAAPWGLGDRRCPAGALSVDVIAAVLDELTASFNWQLAHPAVDSVGHSGRAGWVRQVAYAPTLSFPDPVEVTFST